MTYCYYEADKSRTSQYVWQTQWVLNIKFQVSLSVSGKYWVTHIILSITQPWLLPKATFYFDSNLLTGIQTAVSAQIWYTLG